MKYNETVEERLEKLNEMGLEFSVDGAESMLEWHLYIKYGLISPKIQEFFDLYKSCKQEPKVNDDSLELL